MTLCGVAPPIGRRINYACLPYCDMGMRHGQPCGPNCTCQAHMLYPGSLTCVGTYSVTPYIVRPLRRSRSRH
ncbi:hypothetical protein MTO96_018510 [Rhipicephalus appendiculatus]